MSDTKELLETWIRFQAQVFLSECSLGGDCCHPKCLFAREFLGIPAKGDEFYSHPWRSVQPAAEEWPECEEFYNLMQAYRHAPVTDPQLVVQCYEKVKRWLRYVRSERSR